VGTEKGFFIIDTQTEESICILDNSQLTGSTDSNIVRTIYEDSQGVLWFATGYNLYCYDINNCSFISHELGNQLSVNMVRSIIEDNNGNIWIAVGGEGLFKISSHDGLCTKYGKDDGLPSVTFCFRSAYKSEQGELFFGYIGGLVSFFPDDIIDDINKHNSID
jgi:ligand-binding sensor domain-containing protein